MRNGPWTAGRKLVRAGDGSCRAEQARAGTAVTADRPGDGNEVFRVASAGMVLGAIGPAAKACGIKTGFIMLRASPGAALETRIGAVKHAAGAATTPARSPARAEVGDALCPLYTAAPESSAAALVRVATAAPTLVCCFTDLELSAFGSLALLWLPATIGPDFRFESSSYTFDFAELEPGASLELRDRETPGRDRGSGESSFCSDGSLVRFFPLIISVPQPESLLNPRQCIVVRLG